MSLHNKPNLPLTFNDLVEYSVEVNGPANIVMLLSQPGIEIDENLRQQLLKEAYKTIEYIKKLENPNRVRWHEIPNPTEKS